MGGVKGYGNRVPPGMLSSDAYLATYEVLEGEERREYVKDFFTRVCQHMFETGIGVIFQFNGFPNPEEVQKFLETQNRGEHFFRLEHREREVPSGSFFNPKKKIKVHRLTQACFHEVPKTPRDDTMCATYFNWGMEKLKGEQKEAFRQAYWKRRLHQYKKEKPGMFKASLDNQKITQKDIDIINAFENPYLRFLVIEENNHGQSDEPPLEWFSILFIYKPAEHYPDSEESEDE